MGIIDDVYGSGNRLFQTTERKTDALVGHRYRAEAGFCGPTISRSGIVIETGTDDFSSQNVCELAMMVLIC